MSYWRKGSWRRGSTKVINGKREVVSYDYLIDGMLKGGVHLDLDGKWIADSMGWDGIWGKADDIEQAKNIVLSNFKV